MWRYTPGQPLNDAQEYYHGNEMYSHIAMCQIKMKATILTNKDYQGGKFDRKFFDLIFDEEKGRLFRKYTQCTLSDIDSAYFNERKSDHLPRLADCELYKFPPYLGAPKENMMGSDRPKFGSPEYRRQVRDPKAVLPRSPPLTPATPGEADQPNPAGGGAARGGAALEHLSKGQRLRRNRAARARRHRDESQSPERDPAFDAPTGFSDPDSDDEEVPRQEVVRPNPAWGEGWEEPPKRQEVVPDWGEEWEEEALEEPEPRPVIYPANPPEWGPVTTESVREWGDDLHMRIVVPPTGPPKDNFVRFVFGKEAGE